MTAAAVAERTAGHDTIVGGGLLGLVLALRLAQAGRRVTLFEAAPTLGGLAAPWTLQPQGRRGDNGPPVQWDRYYHVIAGGDRRLLALLAELGLAEALRWRATRTLFFDGHVLHALNNAWDFARLPGLSPLDKARVAWTVWQAMRAGGSERAEHAGARGVAATEQALERRLAAEWLTRIGGQRAWQRLWRPLLAAKLGTNSDIASAAYVAAVIRRFQGAREGAARTERFGHVEGGYARVIDVVAARLAALGVVVHRAAPVESVQARPGGGFTVHAGTRTAAAEHVPGTLIVSTERVWLTCPAPLAARIATVLPEDERARLQALPHQGVVCASLLLTRPLGGAYLTYITDEQVGFTAVIEMSSLVDRVAFGGRHLVYLPCYLPSEHRGFELDDEAWRERFLEGLRRLYPDLADEQIVAMRIARARHVMAVPTRGHRQRVPGPATGVAGLYVVNAAQIVDAAPSVDDTLRLVEWTLVAIDAANVPTGSPTLTPM